MNHTKERPDIEITDAPECWDMPEKEPEVYFAVLGEWPKWTVGYRLPVLNRPNVDLQWHGLTEPDAVRVALEQGATINKVVAWTPKECTDIAIAKGRDGVGVYTYEGDEKVCVRYWLVGDPIPGGGK